MQARLQDLEEYYRLGTIAHTTVRVLSEFISRSKKTTEHKDEIMGTALTATLEHLADAREGFQMQVRSSAVPSIAEMQYLIRRALVDLNWLRDLGWQATYPTSIDLPGHQLMAFSHAYISFAMLPRLPSADVTFPQARPSYSDIPVPTSHGEVLMRLEELEQVIYRVLGGARARLESEPLRRTYGFFESSAWLVSKHQEKFHSA